MLQIPHNSIIENIELIARQAVEGFIIGLHKSPFHGFSVEFAEHRLYNNGDNLRHVDWKVFARKDKMFVKKYEEETNLRCCIAIDTSASMFYPEDGKLNKLQYSCIAAASILLLLQKQLDASALAYFNEELYQLTNVKSDSRHYRQLFSDLNNLINTTNTHKRTNTANALHELAERLHRRSLVIIFSDMPDSFSEESDLLSALLHLRHQKHEVILFHVSDQSKEFELAFENRPMEFVDMETGETLKLNPNDIKDEYVESVKKYRETLQNYCLQHQIDLIPCDINADLNETLYQYMVKRNKMM